MVGKDFLMSIITIEQGISPQEYFKRSKIDSVGSFSRAVTIFQNNRTPEGIVMPPFESQNDFNKSHDSIQTGHLFPLFRFPLKGWKGYYGTTEQFQAFSSDINLQSTALPELKMHAIVEYGYLGDLWPFSIEADQETL